MIRIVEFRHDAVINSTKFVGQTTQQQAPIV